MRQHSHRAIGTMAVLVLSILLAASVPQAHAVTVTQTRHFTTLHQYGSTGYWTYTIGYYLQEDMFAVTYDSAERIVSGNTRACQWSIDVAKYDWYGNATTTFASKVAMVERAENGSGYQSGYWNSTEMNLTRQDEFDITVWMRTRLGSTYSSWVLLSGFTEGMSDFLTEPLGMDKLLASTWNVTYYTERHTATTFVHGVFHLGNSTMDSRISNIQFDDGTTLEEINMLPVGFLLGAMIFIPIGLLIAKKH